MRLIRLLKNDLAREITGWVADKVISIEQAEQICSRYGIDYHQQKRHGYGYFVLVALGYLFVGLAIITLLSANWDDIPRAVRMAGLICSTLTVNAIGLYKAHRQEQAAATIALFLGGLLYGASIMLIAQIYHIGEHYPDGVFWWAAGVLPLALLMRSSLLMMLSGALAFIWFFTESSLHFYPTLFPVFLAAMAWHSLKVKQSNILFLALAIGGGFWLEYSFSWLLGSQRYFEVGVENFSLAAAYFLLLYGVAKWLDTRSLPVLNDYGTLLGLWTLRFTVLSMFVLSFEGPWEEMLWADWNSPALTLVLSIAFALMAIGLVYVGRYNLLIVVVTAVLCLGVTLLLIFSGRERAWAPVLQIVDNVLLICTGGWLIVRGIHDAITHYFFLGILIVLMTALLRYIDLVGDYIGASMLFALFAVILLSAARYWRSRKPSTREAVR